MSAPVSRMSRLSLDAMPPTTRSKSGPETGGPSDQYANEDVRSSSDPDSASDYSTEDEDRPVVRSPTKLLYRVDHLPAKTRAAVRDAFDDPPKIALQRCRRINNTYAFQMTELVTRSIRIRTPDSADARLSCSCGGGEEPCEHLLWLLDQLVKQTLYGHDPDTPLKMTDRGYAEEVEDPFGSIAKHHLDVLADGLHCRVVVPAQDADEPLDATRVRDSRELLSSVHGVSPGEFRPDIFDDPRRGKKTIKRHDLDYTVFRMLLDSHHFFHYFLSVADPSDPIKDPFLKLSQRVDIVLHNLEASTMEPSSPATPAPLSVESPRDVPWAAAHILGCVRLIHSAIYARSHPIKPREAVSAARALVHILSTVVAQNRDYEAGGLARVDRNLYLRLVGDRDRDFVLAELSLLPAAASQFLHSLETILDEIGVHGAPATYVDKFRKLLLRLRAPAAGGGLKRHIPSQGQDRGSKRMK